MSDDREKKDEAVPYEVGYRKPPVQHRFAPNTSGNRRGRPPKAVRAITPRQIRHDIIALAERETTIQTATGERKVSIVEGVLLRLAQKALNGHGPSIRRFLDLFERAVHAHSEVHKRYLSFIELVEISAVETAAYPGDERSRQEHLNRVRKKSRRFLD